MASLTVPESLQTAPKATRERIHLGFLDGLRGLSALYVVLFHIYLDIDYHWLGGGLPHNVYRLSQWMVYGHFAVAIFIVLSGYCLMLPVVRSSSGQLDGGIRGFIKRRFRRIVPPYYAALAISLVLIFIVDRGLPVRGTAWADALPAFTPGIVLSHLFLVQNLSVAWIGKINSPMWSVAMEWQIYFLFACLLVPIARRFGVLLAVIVAFAVGLLPHFLLPASHNFDKTAPWYCGLFALGMAGSVINFSSNQMASVLRTKLPWGLIAGLLTVAFFATDRVRLLRHMVPWLHSNANLWVADLIVGLAATSLIVYCARIAGAGVVGRMPIVFRLLSARPTVLLGSFSYSLYLTHSPIIEIMHLCMLRLNFSPTLCLWLLLAVGTPVCVAAAYLFHLAFERPFLNSRATGKLSPPALFRLSKAPQSEG